MHMKRVIKYPCQSVFAVTNKRSSLETVAEKINQFLESSNQPARYKAITNLEDNSVDIFEISSEALVAKIKLDYVDSTAKRGKFRRATEEEIKQDIPLYVRETYTADIKKQVPVVKKVLDIVKDLDV